MDVSVVGNGNTSWHLVRAIINSPNSLNSVICRNSLKARQKIGLPLNYDTSKDQSNNRSEIVILAISDGSLEKVIKEFRFHPDSLLVHVSGATSINIFDHGHSKSFGVLYPLQSLTAGRPIETTEIPLCIEANNERSLSILNRLASSISDYVYHISSEERLTLHLSAILINNFCNHLMNLGKDFVQQNQLDWNILEPLVKETFLKVLELGPDKSQTGPGIRGDKETIRKHLDLLKGTDLHNLYEVMTSHIIAYHSEDSQG
jgi:predicted short-subunit dehydrogenase-like oxidoreductase (DUF2520 family)